MSESFDPYYRWLAIPPSEQPPNHYRLLGLPLLDDNADVIDSAADRQMAHVRSHATGKHAAASQKLLNELAKARLCLLNPQTKAQYDAQLRADLDKRQPALQPAATAGHVQAAPASTVRPPSVPMRRQDPVKVVEPKSSMFVPQVPASPTFAPAKHPLRTVRHWKLNLAWHVIAPLCGLVVSVFLLCGLFPAMDVLHIFHARKVAEAPPAKVENRSAGEHMAPDGLDMGEEVPKVELPRVEPNPARVEPRAPEPPEVTEPPDVPVPVEPAVDERPKPQVASPTIVRHPVPDTAARAIAETALQVVLDSEPPKQLLQQTLAAEVEPAQRYVLLLRARDKAAAASDANVAFQAVSELERRFDVDVWALKLDTVIKLDEALKADEGLATPVVLKALAEYALPVIDQLLARREYASAQSCVNVALRAARKAEDTELQRQVTLRAIEVQKLATP
jgi:hypothetical protein